MLKLILASVIFCTGQIFASELTLEANSENLGDEKPYIVKVDGNVRIGPQIVNKMVACHNNPPSAPSDFKAKFLELIDISFDEFNSYAQELNSGSAEHGLLTTGDIGLKAFVEGPLEICINRPSIPPASSNPSAAAPTPTSP